MFHKLFKARLLIFDFDGVLIKKIPEEFPVSLLDGFLKYGKSFRDDSMVRFQGTDWIKELEKMGIDTGDQEILKTISIRRREYDKSRLSLYSWVPQLIPDLVKTKKLAILTNNSMVTVKKCLDGLEKYFSPIKGWENTEKLKPNPEGILYICRELDIAPSDVLMVGDSEEDLIAAEKSGAKSLIVVSGDHLEKLFKKYLQNNK